MDRIWNNVKKKIEFGTFIQIAPYRNIYMHLMDLKIVILVATVVDGIGNFKEDKGESFAVG